MQTGASIRDFLYRRLSAFLLREVIFRAFPPLAVFLFVFFPGWVQAQTCAIPGRDAIGPTAGQVNTYYRPAVGTYDASSTTIGLTKVGGGTDITQGDLVLVIQMQCATLNTSNTSAYGEGGTQGRGYTEPGTCAAGRYQYVRASPGSSASVLNLRLDGGTNQLLAAYVQQDTSSFNRRTFQVIRVPQYSALALSGPVTPLYWVASEGVGGVVAIDVTGQLNWNGQTINVSGFGFRGGASLDWELSNDDDVLPDWVETVANNAHATKGEGIGGTPRFTFDPATNLRTDNGVAWGGYANGDDGRGAPATAGGGGNNRDGGRDNGGGGGGGNGGIGGYGGYGWKDSGWGGTFTVADFDMRGIGGARFAAAGLNRLVMGGGGGAGGANNSGDPVAFGGGAGGGIVLVHVGSAVGSGTITANGLAGINNPDNDGASAGGAGGSVVISSQSGALGNLVVLARGGRGGDSYLAGPDSHAGGGGGAGGVVIRASGAAVDVSGGPNGTTNLGSDPVGGAAHGATPGGSGTDIIDAGTPPGTRPGARCLPELNVSKATLTPSISALGAASASYTLVITNAGGAAIGASLVDNALPPGWTFAQSTGITFSPTLSATVFGGFVEGPTPGLPAVTGSPGGTANLSVNGTPAAAPVWGRFTVPGQVNGSPGRLTLSFAVSIPATATVGCYHNPAGLNFYDPTRSDINRTVTIAANNTANRAGAMVGGTVTTAYQTNPGPGTTVGGSNYSGLEAGPSAEDVCLNGDLSISKSAPASVTAGATLSYTLTPRNNGRGIGDLNYATHQATSRTGTETLALGTVRVRDTLPVGLTLTAAPTPFNWTCTPAGQTITCDRVGPVAPISAATSLDSITLTTRVSSAACAGPATNTVTISGFSSPLADLAPSNNTATAVTSLICSANLQVTKTNNVTQLYSGQTTSYTVTFSNLGPSAADNAIVVDTPGPGLGGCSVSACTAAGGLPAATCPATPADILTPGGTSLPSFPAGGVVRFVVDCLVTATGT